MSRPARLIIEARIRKDFTARLRVPLDLNATEAHTLATALFVHALDPSEAAKFACVEPDIYPGITE